MVAAIKRFPLIIEPHPKTYDGHEFITLIIYNDKKFLCIVDNISSKFVYAYVLDLCAAQDVDENEFIGIVYDWFYNHRDDYPISIEFHKRGIVEDAEKIMRSFQLNYITRAIGPVPMFNMIGPSKIKKRKRKEPKKQYLLDNID